MEDTGFQHLVHTLERGKVSCTSRKHFTETVVPSIKSGIQAKVRKFLEDVVCITFMTDIWSTEVSNDLLLSLRAYWLASLDFERKLSVLHAQVLHEACTGVCISGKFDAMLDKRGIERQLVHLVLRDNE